MKKTVFVALSSLAILSIMSCGNKTSPDNADHNYSADSRTVCADNSMDTEYPITDEQKEFLLNNMFNESAVEMGKLKPWQIELLDNYNFCMSYLSDKYPEHSFQITTYDKVSSRLIKFVVIPDDNEDAVFTVNVTEKGKERIVTDSFDK